MLDKIRKSRIKSSIAIAVATFISAIIIWPLLDLIWYNLISHHEFQYSVMDHIVQPAILSVVFGIVSHLTWKAETKLEKKAKAEEKSKKK